MPEILFQFCQKYGYKIEFKDFSDTNSLVLSVSSGKCDFAGSTISVTEERKKIIDFSTPYFENTGIVVINKEEVGKYTDLSYLNGKRIGVITGTIYHNIINKKINQTAKPSFVTADIGRFYYQKSLFLQNIP